MKLEKIEEDIKKDFSDKIKEQEQMKSELLKKISILKKYDKNKPKDKEEIKELFRVLCFNNLGFCCGLEKPCIWRNSVLKILNINPQKFKEIKEKLGFDIALP